MKPTLKLFSLVIIFVILVNFPDVSLTLAASPPVLNNVPLSLPDGWSYSTLYGAWGSSETDMYAFGSAYVASFGNDEPLLFHNDGTGWANMPLPLPSGWHMGQLYGMWGANPLDLYIVGEGVEGRTVPLLYHGNGSNWTPIPILLPDGWFHGTLISVWGSGSNDIYAVGWGQRLSGGDFPLAYHYDGSTWTYFVPAGLSGGYFSGVWGSGASDIYIAGIDAQGALLVHYDGTGWTRVSLNLPTGLLRSLWGRASDDVYAVGWENSRPLIYHYDGVQWTASTPSLPSGASSGTLYGVWGSNLGDTYAVGSAGGNPLLYRNDGTGWTALDLVLPAGQTGGDINAVWASSSRPGVVYAAGKSWGSSSGLPLLYQGSIASDPLLSPGETVRVSVDSSGGQGDGVSYAPSISADGRYIAFNSDATNLVPNATFGMEDVFVHDMQTGLTTLVSVDSNGMPGNGYSYYPSISGDGRYVAFHSSATNLVPNDTNGVYDIFVHDMQTGMTSRVSVDSSGEQANGGSSDATISADGRYIAFASSATNVVPGDTNAVNDIFIHDMDTGVTTRISIDTGGIQGNDHSFAPSISGNGHETAFYSLATNLVSNDTNGAPDVFIYDLQTGRTTLVSVDSSGVQGNNASRYPSISANGQYVAFDSNATNLVSDDINATFDIFVHDLQTGLTRRVSIDSSAVQGNDYSFTPSISADGRYVAFYSTATNLVSDDTNGASDIFVHDMQSGITRRVSVDRNGVQANDSSNGSFISADGGYIAFDSGATNLVLGDTNSKWDIFVHRQEVDSSSPTPTPTPAWTSTATPPTFMPPTLTPSPTPSSTSTRTPTRTATATIGYTPTFTQTATPAWTGTATPSSTPTSTPTRTSTSTATGTAIPTGTNTPAFTATPAINHERDTTGVFRPSNGLLYLKNSNDTGFADIAINYGLGGDYPIVGDWDGDGDATIGIYRNGKFYLRNDNSLGFADVVFAFGQVGDQPIAGDWNGDGVDTIGIFRPSIGQFLLRNSNTEGNPEMSFYLGNVGDVGIAGDWDGDGLDTTGVFRPSNGVIFLKNKNEDGFADIALNYGLPGDRPLTGDWDNDGIDTIGVYRGGQFMLRNENTIGFAELIFGLGNPGDMPIAGNWDGLP